MNGWIDDVHKGIVYGRLIEDGQEYEFSLPVLDVLECQRVELEPCRYVSFVNGYLLIDKTIWTTHDVETAARTAKAIYQELWPGTEALVLHSGDSPQHERKATP